MENMWPVYFCWLLLGLGCAAVGAVILRRYRRMRRSLMEYGCELNILNREIEQAKEQAAAVSSHKSRLEQMFHNAPVAYAAVGANNRIININREFEQVFGFCREEVLGDDFYRLLNIADYAAAEENLAAGGQRVSHRYAIVTRRRRDGTPLTLSMAAYPFTAGDGQTGTYIVYRDISRQAAAERRIRESEKQYRLLAANMEDMVWLLDGERNFIYVSPSTEKALGFNAREFLALPPERRLTAALAAALDELAGHNIGTGNTTGPVRIEEERERRDGSRIWLESSVSLAYEENGDSLGLLIVSRNITARKHTEKLLSAAYAQKRKTRFFNAVLNGDFGAQEIYSEARQLQLYLPPFFTVGFILLSGGWPSDAPEERDRLMDEAAGLLSGLEGVFAWNAADGIGFIARLTPASDRRAQEETLSQTCLASMQTSQPRSDLYIGFGDYADGFVCFVSRFRHARTAARIGSRRRDDAAAQWYEECGVEEVFEHFAGKKEAAAFVERTLGPLLEYDRQADGELLTTLEKLLAGLTLKEIAEQLFIHHKTAALRKQRIEALLGVSLSSFEDSLRLGAALQIRQILLAESRC